MTPARLAEIKDRCGDEEGATAADARDLLAEVQRLLAALPACPEHGPGCVPHALEWIARAKAAPTYAAAERDQALAEVKRLRAWLARIAAGHGWPTPTPGTQGIMAQAALDGEPAP